MQLHYSPDNPITARLLRRRGPLDWCACLWLLVFLVILMLLDERAGSWEVGMGLGGLLYLVARTARDCGILNGWRQGRSLEEMLLALTPWQIVDGVAGFSLLQTLQIGLAALALGLVVATLAQLPALFWFVCGLLPILLSAVFALVYLALGSWPGGWLIGLIVGLTGAYQSDDWLEVVPLVLVATGYGARSSAAGWLAREANKVSERAGGPKRIGRPAALWSENPIVVRELRREARRAGGSLWLHRYGTFALFLMLMALNLFCRAPISGARVQWSACLLLGALLVLQTVRAALATCGAVSCERESNTLESLALSGLSPDDFIRGWAELGWRLRMWENLVAVAASLLLILASLAMMPEHPPECSYYVAPFFENLTQALDVVIPMMVLLPLLTVAAGGFGTVGFGGF